MKIDYKLSESDILTHQLYIASKSKRVKSQRFKSWILLTISFATFAFLFNFYNIPTMRNYFVVVSLIILVFYPRYTSFRYRKHYLNNVKEKYAYSIGKTCSIVFKENELSIHDEHGNSSILKNSEINEISELPEHYLIQLKNQHSIIIPKKNLENFTDFVNELEKISDSLNIRIENEKNWYWK